MYIILEITKANMAAINFETNPQLLDNAQWYPPPQGDPQDILSFAPEQAYICYIDKTHAVFRHMNTKGSYIHSTSLLNPKALIGVDLLLEHNLSKSVLEKIKAIVADILFPLIGPNPREVGLLIVQYYDCRSLLAETLYPLVMQEALTQRKMHCALSVQRGNRYTALYSRQERAENYHNSMGSIFNASNSTFLPDLKRMENVDPQKKIFKTEFKQRRWIYKNAPYVVSPATKIQGRSSFSMLPSSYINSNYQAVLPPDNPAVHPIINEHLHPLIVRDRQIPPFVAPDRSLALSCCDLIWNEMETCFRVSLAIIDRCCSSFLR